MKTIYKYTFHSRYGYNTLNIPFDAKLLRVDRQKNNLVAWFEVDTSNTEGRYHVFYIAFTGETVQDGLEYVNTVIFDDDDLVVHVYKEM